MTPPFHNVDSVELALNTLLLRHNILCICDVSSESCHIFTGFYTEFFCWRGKVLHVKHEKREVCMQTFWPHPLIAKKLVKFIKIFKWSKCVLYVFLSVQWNLWMWFGRGQHFWTFCLSEPSISPHAQRGLDNWGWTVLLLLYALSSGLFMRCYYSDFWIARWCTRIIVYLLFDHNSSCSMYLENVGLGQLAFVAWYGAYLLKLIIYL